MSSVQPGQTSVPTPTANRWQVQWPVLARGLAGALVGGLIGYFLFRWLRVRGMAGYAIPGGLIGICAGLLARGKSYLLAAVCAIAAFFLTVYLEWSAAPFRQDGSFLYFLTHLHQMDGAAFKLAILALGVACAYWLGRGR
jgi:hypothetical protein